VLAHRTRVNTFGRTERIPSMFLDDSRLKIQFSDSKRYTKSPGLRKSRNTLSNNTWVKEEVKRMTENKEKE
jgi:hypothetical protein